MSIVFFKRNELDIIQDGELDSYHLSVKLSSMRHGCIFVQNCFEELIGYVDDNLVKQCIVSGSNVFVKPFSTLIVEEDESKLVGLDSIMKETGIEVLPVTDRHRRLSAAFIKTYPEELQAFDRLLLGLAFSALPTFEGQFLNYLYQKRYRKVILFGNDRDCQMIENCLRNRINTERYTGYKKEYDENSVLILDMLFSKTYRQYFFSNWEKANICTLESILAV